MEMIHKLISKSQVSLLEYEGNPSRDYKDGYCRAIHDVLDLEPIPTLGADEYEKYKAEYENRLKADMVAMLEDLDLQIDELGSYNHEVAKVQRLIRDRIDKLKEVEDGNNS